MPVNDDIRFEPDERPPALLTLNVALQGAVLIVTNVVTFIVIYTAAFGDGGSYAEWAVVGGLGVAGVLTALHASRLGPGLLLLWGSGIPFMVPCILAVEAGGPALAASLAVTSSLLQLAMAAGLARLRRLITPVVAGVAFMMISLSAMPIAMRRISDVPEGASELAGTAVGVITLVVAALAMLRATGLWRLWAMPIAIVVGCAGSVALGTYDGQPALDAPWLDFPDVGDWPGFASVFDADYWSLLPVFLVISAVVAARATSEGVSAQEISHRTARAVDFRGVQRTVGVGGLAVFLSGVAGTLPAISYLPATISLLSFTRVAARRVGLVMGAMLIVLALLPKAVAALITIPRPVSGALLMAILGLLFIEGVRAVTRDGLSRHRGFIVGLSLSVAVGLQSQPSFLDLLGDPIAALLGNGVLVGVVIAVLLTSVFEMTSARRQRFEALLDRAAFGDLDQFLRTLGGGLGWNSTSVERLRAAGEETLTAMMQLLEDNPGDVPPRVVLNARPGTGSVELEFLALFSEENIEDRISYLNEQASTPDVGDLSFRLLRLHAAAVRHRRYHGIDVVTVEVEGSAS